MDSGKSSLVRSTTFFQFFWGLQGWTIFPLPFEDSGGPLSCFGQRKVSEGDRHYIQTEALSPVFTSRLCFPGLQSWVMGNRAPHEPVKDV